jgi:desulfoferrodoxin (superoxide reductase-like protein)
MRRLGLIFIIIMMIGLGVLYADVPTVNNIEVNAAADGSTLIVTVRHSGPSNIHYVSEIEVKIGDNVKKYKFDPQDSVVFTEEIKLDSSSNMQVRAFCTLHGWSAWVSSGSDEPEKPIEEPSGGIPGFPLMALGVGLFLFTIRRFYL